MKTWLFASLMLLTAGPLLASDVTIVSPDHAQTWAYGKMTESRFFWNDKDQILYADITFSTAPYATESETAEKEYYLFKLPGVEFNPVSKLFVVRDGLGGEVPVAEMKEALIGHLIQPAAGALVYVYKKSGEVSVALTASTEQEKFPLANHWIEQEESSQ